MVTTENRESWPASEVKRVRLQALGSPQQAWYELRLRVGEGGCLVTKISGCWSGPPRHPFLVVRHLGDSGALL